MSAVGRSRAAPLPNRVFSTIGEAFTFALVMASMQTHEKVNGRRPSNSTPAHHGSAIGRVFSRFSHATAHASGTPAAFLIAALAIVVWGTTGPLFGFSDTWQLVINTGTTIVTFLMVFLIQNTQNRDTMALQLKLSELIIAMKGAKNSLATVEDLTEEELEELHKELCARADAANEELTTRRKRKP
jgi:low affinity Fe/Cu permease